MRRSGTTKLISTSLLMLFVALAPQGAAFPGGISGPVVDAGCTCHGGGVADADVQLIWHVNESWSADAPLHITLEAISDVPLSEDGAQGGLNVRASHGTLAAADDTTQVVDGELTHTEEGNRARTWNFTWSSDGGRTDLVLTAAVNTVNGDGSADAGDRWQISSVEVATPFDEAPAQVQEHGAGTGNLIYKGIGVGLVICFFIIRWKPATGSLANQEADVDDSQ